MIRVTRHARTHRVQAKQWERREFGIESDAVGEGVSRVTLGARVAEIPSMNIVASMTGHAVRSDLARLGRARVARRTLNDLMCPLE